jgi:hypothetical protein
MTRVPRALLRLVALLAVLAFAACKRDPAMQMLEAPPELQRCVPAGDQYGSLVEVRFGEGGRGVATHGCFSTSHDAECIKQYVSHSSRGESGETKRMLIARTVVQRDSGTPYVGLVTFAELGARKFTPLGTCALQPL